MERLTQDDFDYCLNNCSHSEKCTFTLGYGLTCPEFRRYKRLAEYEVTGLIPTEIIKLNDFEHSQCAKLLAENGRLSVKLAEWKRLENKGLIFDISKQYDLVRMQEIIHSLIEQYEGVPVPKETIDYIVLNLVR